MKKLLASRLGQLLCGFAIGHLGITLALDFLSRSPFLQTLHNRQGIWNFAIDSQYYLDGILRLRHTLQTQGWQSWLYEPAWLHEKFFSIPFYLLGPSIFSAIIVNTPLYVLTLWLVYQITQLLFDTDAAKISLILTAVLPSYLLHSTQLLRDSLFIPAQLVFLWGLVILIHGKGLRNRQLEGTLFGLVGYLLIWAIKPHMAPFYLFFEILTLGLVLYQADFKHLPFKIIGACGLIIAASLTVSLQLQADQFRRDLPSEPTVNSTSDLTVQSGSSASPVSPTASSKTASLNFRLRNYLLHQFQHIAILREGFRHSYLESSSNIDMDIAFRRPSDMLRYVPRALQIGFTAPFPTLWLERGKETGWIGRLTSGIEMCFMYLIMILAARTVWGRRNEPALWLLAGFVVAGVLLNAMVVTNVGALYRFRLVYWLLLIMMAAPFISRRSVSESSDF
jgi:hypothetical protein